MTNYDAYVWTDGSSSKDGFGGCAAILISGSRQLIITAGAYETTNQKMELMAAIIGLRRLWWRGDQESSSLIRSRKRVKVFSDSAYLTNCFNEGWIKVWRANGWNRSGGGFVKNREFWETLESLVAEYKLVKFILVRGHSGNRYNELAVEQAVKARVSMKARKQNIQHLIGEKRFGEVTMAERPQDSSRPRKGRGRRRVPR